MQINIKFFREIILDLFFIIRLMNVIKMLYFRFILFHVSHKRATILLRFT